MGTILNTSTIKHPAFGAYELPVLSHSFVQEYTGAEEVLRDEANCDAQGSFDEAGCVSVRVQRDPLSTRHGVNAVLERPRPADRA
jgi:hypothetical protein